MGYCGLVGRRLLLPQVVLIALVTTAGWGVLPSAAQQSAARSDGSAPPRYTEGEVLIKRSAS